MLVVARIRGGVDSPDHGSTMSLSWARSDAAVRWCCDLLGRERWVDIERELLCRIANGLLGVPPQC